MVELVPVPLLTERREPARADRRALPFAVLQVLTAGLRVGRDPRVVRCHPEEIQVDPHPEIRALRRREEVLLVIRERRFDGPPVVIVLPQRPRFLFADIEVRHEREPPHPIVRLEDVLLEVVLVRGQRLLVLASRHPLGSRVEVVREFLLGLVGVPAELALILAEQRHSRPVREALARVDGVVILHAERRPFFLPLVGVLRDVALRIRDDEVHIQRLQPVHHLAAGELGVHEQEADVEVALLDAVDEVFEAIFPVRRVHLELVRDLERQPIGHHLRVENPICVVRVVHLLRPDHAGKPRLLVRPGRDVGGVHGDREVSRPEFVAVDGIEEAVRPLVELRPPRHDWHAVDVVPEGLCVAPNIAVGLESAVVGEVLQLALGRPAGLAEVEREVEMDAVVVEHRVPRFLDGHVVAEEIERTLRVSALQFDGDVGDAPVVREPVFVHLGELVPTLDADRLDPPGRVLDELLHRPPHPVVERLPDGVLVGDRVEAEYLVDGGFVLCFRPQ